MAGANFTKFCACHAKSHERQRQHRTSHSRASAESGSCKHERAVNIALAMNDITHTRRNFTKCYACHEEGHSHHVPFRPGNFRFVTAERSSANVLREKHATPHVSSAVAATKNRHGHVRSAPPARRDENHLKKTKKEYCACQTKRFVTLDQTHRMSRSAAPVRQSNITTSFETIELQK